MKSNLLSKFIVLYFAIVIVGFWFVSTLSYSLNYKIITEQTSSSMYDEAKAIADRYAHSYFDKENLLSIRGELATVSLLGHTRVMLLDPKGYIVLDTGSDTINFDTPYYLEDFNPTITGNQKFQIGSFFGIFNNNTMSVIYPVSGTYSTKGYIAVHMPLSTIKENVSLIFNSNYFTYLTLIMLTMVFLVFFYLQVHKPLREIIKGVNQYGKGDLSYKIKDLNNDEIGRLADALNYMVSELNENDKFQQKFISNISHDFRSPLTSIKGYLEAIQDGMIPPEMINKYIDIVLFETERLTKLTSNILTLNDLDPKSTRLDITTFDINGIIKHTIETFEGICKGKKISFKLTFSTRMLHVNADISKIQQVIYNLIDNAIKFSPPNSIISINTSERGEKVYVSIKDSGCGIPKEHIEKIWNRFYKSDISRGKDKKGSGLGLSIVKEILQLHGANIDVISTVGVGTEFTFSLPKAKYQSTL